MRTIFLPSAIFLLLTLILHFSVVFVNIPQIDLLFSAFLFFAKYLTNICSCGIILTEVMFYIGSSNKVYGASRKPISSRKRGHRIWHFKKTLRGLLFCCLRNFPNHVFDNTAVNGEFAYNFLTQKSRMSFDTLLRELVRMFKF